MEFDNKEKQFDWEEEEARLKKAFDFEAFLGREALDDRITDATDGKDLLQPDAFDFAPDYIPRRPGESDRGRHEAPGQEADFVAEQPEEDAPAMDPTDPRYAAPERPRVLVADRRPTVYVTPSGDFEEADPAPAGGGEGKSWLIAIVITLGIVAAVLAVVLGVLGGRNDEPAAEASESAPAVTAAVEEPAENTHAPEETESPQVTAEPEQTPKPTEAPRVTLYTITVTAGTGGSISPSGAVAVEEGQSITFSIAPDSGYVLSQLMVDGNAVTPAEIYTFNRVQEDHTIYAVFQPEATPTPEPTPTATPEPTTEPTAEPTAPPASDPEQPAPAEEVTEAAE